MHSPTEATSAHTATLPGFAAMGSASPVRGQGSREQAHASGHGVEASAD